MNLLGGREQTDRYRQIEAWTGLAHVRGGKVDRDALLGELEPRVENGRPHPLARLAHGPVGEADQRERGEPCTHVDFDGDALAGNPLEGKGGDAGEHGASR